MDHFPLDFDFDTTAQPAGDERYNTARDVRLAVGSLGREIHAEVTLVRAGGVVSVKIAYSWFGAMPRDAAKAAFVAALREGMRSDGRLQGRRPFLRAVRTALYEGAEIL